MKPKERFKSIPEAYIVLQKGNQVLLSLRKATGYEDGNYGLISGHVEEIEPISIAAVREAKEEAGVIIDPKDLILEHVMHRLSDRNAIGFFFVVEKWNGEPVNKEPEKCGGLTWFAKDSLPKNTIPYIQEVLTHISKKVIYSNYGWPK